MRGDIRLLALDLDGTLLRSDLSVSERNRAAVAACLDRSIHVVLATGRIYPTVTPYLGLWPDRPIWIAAGNGAVIYPPGGGPPLLERLIDLGVARELLAWAEAEGVYVKTYVNDQLFVHRVTEETLHFRERHGVEFVHQPDLAEHLPAAPAKLVMVDEPDRLAASGATIRRRWGDALEITGSTPDSLEVSARGATKGAALHHLAHHLGLAREQVAAIGNERNDLSMITWAGRGATVANAAKEVLAVAPQVVAGNDEDGVAEFIESWLG